MALMYPASTYNSAKMAVSGTLTKSSSPMPGPEPRSDTRPKSKELSIIYFQIFKSVSYHCSPRFSLATMTIEGWLRVDWTGWCQHSLSACCHMTFRMASTFALRSWAVEMVSVSVTYTFLRKLVSKMLSSLLQLSFHLLSSPFLQVIAGRLLPLLPLQSPQ